MMSCMTRKKQLRQAARDAEYRQALGLPDAAPRSGALGSGHSPAPIGKGKPRKQSAEPIYRGKRRVRNRGVTPQEPNLPLTTEQLRSVRCPRCLARPGHPCRNQYGRVVSGGHTDRRWKAREVHRRELIRRTPKDEPMSFEEHAELVERRKNVRDPGRIPRRRRARVDNGGTTWATVPSRHAP